MRGFEKVSKDEFNKYSKVNYEKIIIPSRKTNKSAGYDFNCPYEVVLKPKDKVIIASGIKAFMEDDEVLLLVVRSSLGIKKGLKLLNQVGVIDSDYYNNESNEGHILIGIENCSDEEVIIKENEAIVQGVFIKYLIATCEERVETTRKGGIGSTNIKAFNQ